MKTIKFIAEFLFYALLGVLVICTGGMALVLFGLVLLGRIFWRVCC